MADLPSQVLYPSSFQELFTVWKRFSGAELYAGGTGIIRDQGKRVPSLPRNIISLNKLEDLHKINRTERYLEIGAMVKLSGILNQGKMVPEALAQCIRRVAGPQVRNLATIGGNLCNPSQRLDCAVPMIALDAQFELRTAQTSRWVQASRFFPQSGLPVLEKGELLTRVRIPLAVWSGTWYRKFRSIGSNEPGNGILFIMRHERDNLSEIRVVYSGKSILREKTSETMLAGKRLPLERKDAAAFVERWRNYLPEVESGEETLLPEGASPSPPESAPAQREQKRKPPELAAARILSFIENTFLNLS